LTALCSEVDKKKLINTGGLVITGNLTLGGSLIYACSNFGPLIGDLNGKHLVGGVAIFAYVVMQMFVNFHGVIIMMVF
jgi:hypothetical protein